MKFSIFVFLLLMCVFKTNALPPEEEIARIKKGEYYFYYLTQDFPSAMTLLMQLREENVLGKELDVMEAAMLLSLGLHRQAQEIFEKIQRDGRESSSKSWFYLARRWFELGEFDHAIYSVNQMDLLNVKLDFQLESQFMLASSYIELGTHAKAEKIIANMPRSAIWTGYARHNYIIAMMHGNSSGRSLNLLIEDATFYLPETEEAKNLRDRINLISAIHFMELGQNRSAMKHLKLISLEGPYTPAALLQYGWVNVEQGDYKAALQPWRELQTRFNLFDPDVMESMIGIPQVFELMKAYTQAIKSYESIETKLLAMKQFITVTQDKLKTAEWLDSWITTQSDPRWGWQSELETTVPFSDVTGLLHPMLSENSTVNDLREYRDLNILTQYLKEKEQDLLLWKDMIKRRKLDALSRNSSPDFIRADHIIAESESRYEELLDIFNNSSKTSFSLATQEQNISLEALSKSNFNLKQLIASKSPTRDIELYRLRWSRVNGLLLWQMSEMKPKMQWQLQRDLITLNRYISNAQRQLSETKLADKWSDSSWYGLNERVDDLLLRTTLLQKISEANKEMMRDNLISKTENYLSSQQARIKDYLAQSRLSIARLYDEALQRRLVDGDMPEEKVYP